jgi:phosphoglycolate phosphatase
LAMRLLSYSADSERDRFNKADQTRQPLCRVREMLFLFDIDGTLVSGDGAGRRAFDRACLEILGVAGALGSGDGAIKLDGMTDPLILAHVFERHFQRSGSADECQAVLDRYIAHLPGELRASKKYWVHEGVHEALDLLHRRGAAIGLATGNLREGARLKLEHAQLWHRFAFGGFASDAADRAELVAIGIARGRAHHGKPVSDDQVWVIGDTPRDVHAAHKAGARCVGVATGSYDVAALRESGADVAVPTLHDWIAML